MTDRWASFCWTKGAEKGDAFLMKEWPDKAFIFPPAPLLDTVVAKLTQQKGSFILIAPIPRKGSTTRWQPIISSLITSEPLVLGKTREVCRLRTGKKPDIPGYLAAFVRSRCSRTN